MSNTKNSIEISISSVGENYMVDTMSFMGFGQEDSMILNRSAIEKGLFRAQSLKKYYDIP